METIEEQVIETLEKIRPILAHDNGDVEFVRFEDGIVYIKMLGACYDCLFLDQTVSESIEALLIEEVKGVLGVKVINEEF